MACGKDDATCPLAGAVPVEPGHNPHSLSSIRNSQGYTSSLVPVLEGGVDQPDQQEGNNSKGIYQGALCGLGTPCYIRPTAPPSWSWAWLLLGPSVCDLTSYRCHRPSYFASAWVDQPRGVSTRAMLAVSALLLHLYISSLPPVVSW